MISNDTRRKSFPASVDESVFFSKMLELSRKEHGDMYEIISMQILKNTNRDDEMSRLMFDGSDEYQNLILIFIFIDRKSH